MDALRAICMVLGIVLHGTIAYKVVPLPNWTYDNVFHHPFFDVAYHIIHAFRMPLFFVVAGYFARLLILKIGIRGFVLHRFKRIVIPFIGSCIFILPLSILPFLWFTNSLNNTLSLHEVWSVSAKGLLHWNGLAHLWFLYYLILFYAFVLLVSFLLRLKVFYPLQKILDHLLQMPRASILFNFFFLALLMYFLPASGVIVDTSVFPDVFILSYYLFWFLAGWLINRAPGLFAFASRWFGLLLLLGFGCTYLLLSNLSVSFLMSGTPYYALLKSLESVLLVFGFCGFFLIVFRSKNPGLQYFSDASYWMYLVHLGIVAALHILLTYTNVPGSFRFIIVVVVTLFVTIVSYHFFVRYSWLGRLLHGPRHKPNASNTDNH